MGKVGYLLRKIQTSQVNNPRISLITIAKFSGYCFLKNTNIYGNFQTNLHESTFKGDGRGVS